MNVLFLFIYISKLTLPTNPDAVYESFPKTVAAPIP